jgi:hypothetical protein
LTAEAWWLNDSREPVERRDQDPELPRPGSGQSESGHRGLVEAVTLQPGTYEVKIAVHDEISGRLGAQQGNHTVEEAGEYTIQVRLHDSKRR